MVSTLRGSSHVFSKLSRNLVRCCILCRHCRSYPHTSTIVKNRAIFVRIFVPLSCASSRTFTDNRTASARRSLVTLGTPSASSFASRKMIWKSLDRWTPACFFWLEMVFVVRFVLFFLMKKRRPKRELEKHEKQIKMIKQRSVTR